MARDTQAPCRRGPPRSSPRPAARQGRGACVRMWITELKTTPSTSAWRMSRTSRGLAPSPAAGSGLDPEPAQQCPAVGRWRDVATPPTPCGVASVKHHASAPAPGRQRAERPRAARPGSSGQGLECRMNCASSAIPARGSTRPRTVEEGVAIGEASRRPDADRPGPVLQRMRNGDLLDSLVQANRPRGGTARWRRGSRIDVALAAVANGVAGGGLAPGPLAADSSRSWFPPAIEGLPFGEIEEEPLNANAPVSPRRSSVGAERRQRSPCCPGCTIGECDSVGPRGRSHRSGGKPYRCYSAGSHTVSPVGQHAGQRVRESSGSRR